jgi:hypothetical protein
VDADAKAVLNQEFHFGGGFGFYDVSPDQKARTGRTRWRQLAPFRPPSLSVLANSQGLKAQYRE